MLLSTALILSLAFACPAFAGDASGFKKIYDPPASWPAGVDLVQHGESNNFFTAWLDTDSSSGSGTGDYENVKAILETNTAGTCNLPCDQPVGVQWDLVDTTHKAEIDNCVVLKPEKFSLIKDMTYPGFNCFDAYQMGSTCSQQTCEAIGMRKQSSKRAYACDLCPNFKVRYLCPDATKTCSSKRSFVDADLDQQLETLDKQIHTKDNELRELRERAEGLSEQNSKKESADLKNLLRELMKSYE